MVSQKMVHMVICPSARTNLSDQQKLSSYIVKRRQKKQDFSSYLQKINDEKKVIELINHSAKKPLSKQSYDALLEHLIERNKKYFTEEFGKNEIDFENYVRNTTNIYRLEDINWIYNLEKPFDLKEEIKAYIGDDRSPLIQIKKIKQTKKKQSTFIDSKPSAMARESSGSIDNTHFALPYSYKLEPFIYKLSDPEMTKRGITVDPKTMMPIKLFVFETDLTNPEISWFQQSRNLFYPTNTICSFAFPDGTGHLYSKDGVKSISFLNGTLGKMIVVYSSRKRYFDGKFEPAPLAIFDLIGNGVVYDEDGEKRLIFDQAQGVLFETPSKIPLKWRWKNYEIVIRRREELKNYRTDELIDFEQDPYKIVLKKDLRLPKVKGRLKREDKVAGKSSLGDKYPSKIKSLQSARKLKNNIQSFKKPTKNKKIVIHLPSHTKNNEVSSPKHVPVLKLPKEEIKVNKGRPISELVDTPALLKFSEGGCCVIEPLLGHCSEELKRKKESEEESVHQKVPSFPMKKTSRRVKEKRSMKATECFPAPDNAPLSMKISSIKPIVLKINDTVSITITSQGHIHIDFLSHPIHFMFNIGVTVTSTIKHVYASINPTECKEIIPCFFEVLHTKCAELHSINQKLKMMREEANNKLCQSQSSYLKNWGYNIYLDKLSYSNLLYSYNQTRKPCFCPCKRKINSVIN